MLQSMALTTNGLLDVLVDLLPNDDLTPYLKKVFLDNGRVLFDAGQPPERVWFPTSCAVSLLADTGQQVIEAAMISREGAVGLSGIFWPGSMPISARVRIGGEALEADARFLRRILRQHSEAYDLICCYLNSLCGDFAVVSLCNRFHSTRERLASKLLRMRECLRSDSFAVTHANLAEAIGVTRSVITETILEFRQEGCVESERSRITIVKRRKLRHTASNCHTFFSHEKYFSSLSAPP